MFQTANISPVPNPADVIGPYSQWPRRRPQKAWKAPAILATTIVSAGVFVHCAVPMIF